MAIDHQKIGFRTQTRPNNGGYSEISIDDQQGHELIKIHAQRDMNVEVIRNESISVGGSQSTSVGGPESHSAHDITLTAKKLVFVDAGEEIAATSKKIELSASVEASVWASSVKIDGGATVAIAAGAEASFASPTILVIGNVMVMIQGSLVSIKGNTVSVEGTAISVRGDTVDVEGSTVNVTASGTVHVRGASVNLNC
jgi:hypothetical protein